MKRVSTKDVARGRWHEILPMLGFPANCLNRKNQACPLCGGNDRFRYTNVNNEGDYYCNQCGTGHGIMLLMKYHGWDFKRAVQEIDKVIGNTTLPKSGPEFHSSQAGNPGSLRRLYADSEPIHCEDPVGRYLFRRQLHRTALEPYPKALRYVAKMRHQDGEVVTYHPGMIAVFSDVSGKSVTIHRTYLTHDGFKAPVKPVRKFMMGKVPAGGAIRLSKPGEAFAESIGVAEGIETALSASWLFGKPVWATTGDAMLKQWQPPVGVNHVVIFGDSDLNYAGQAAAYALAKRLKTEGQCEVEVSLPPMGKDWNDVLQEESHGQETTDA